MNVQFSGRVLLVVLALVIAGCGSVADRSAPVDGAPQGSGSPSMSPSAASGLLRGRLVARLRLVGLAQPLLVTRDEHPRGGLRTRVYVGGSATELTDPAGNPVVPFVATDTRPTSHVSVACVPGGLEVDVATPTVPSGVLVAWDIDRTTYRVDTAGAHVAGRERVGTSVPERTLRQDWPELARDRMFVGCRPWGAPVA